VDLIKNTVAKGVTDDELKLFLWVARKHKLDPMTRQLHAVKRKVEKHHQDEKGIWVAGEVMTIQIGIDGYRSMAAVSHPDFGGVDEPEYEFAKAGDKIPTMARIRVWKKGFDHPSIGIAYWDEYAPADLSNPKCFMWKKMPKHMLAKCAEALALRKAYPDLADIYVDEEMHQADQDYTPGGRRIVQQDGCAPSGMPVTYEARTGSHEAGQAVLQQKKAELEEKVKKQKEAGKSAPVKEATFTPDLSKPGDIPPAVKTEPVKQLADDAPRIEIEWTPKGDAIVRGDLANIIGDLQKACLMDFLEGWWHVLGDDVTKLCEIAIAKGYRVQELLPEKTSPVPSSHVSGETPQKGGEGTKAPAKEPSPAGEWLSGVIEQGLEKMTKGGPKRPSVPYVSVLIKVDKRSQWYSVYKKDFFAPILAGKGKPIEFLSLQRGDWHNLVDLKRVGKIEFADGLPCIQKDREPGNPGLFP